MRKRTRRESSGSPNSANNIYSEGVPFCVAAQDAYEENDTYGSATPISLNEVQRHNVGKTEDEDWLSFQASEGVTYTIHTLDLDLAADTIVSLFDTNGTTLLESNDDTTGPLASRIDWNAPVSGQYYLRVHAGTPMCQAAEPATASPS